MSYCGHPFVRWVAVGVLCLSLGACAGRAPAPRVEPAPARAPVLTPQQVLATLHAREANITSLKGLFQADVEGSFSPFSHSIQGTLFYQRPRSIRIKGFTRFGGTLFDFLLNGRPYSLHTADRLYPIVGRVPGFSSSRGPGASGSTQYACRRRSSRQITMDHRAVPRSSGGEYGLSVYRGPLSWQ